MMTKKGIWARIMVAALAVAGCFVSEGANYTQWVNPLIGSAGDGNVWVGASVPFGMVQLGPTSVPMEWHFCSGYNRSDSTVIGFSQNHLSGTGSSDLMDVNVMPVTGEVKYARGTVGDPQSGMWSLSDRRREVAEPGYYKTYLSRYGIMAEMTATCRVGLHRYTFPASEDAAIVVDLESGQFDHATAGYIRVIDECTIEGFRFSDGWAQGQRVYFAAQFSKPFRSVRLIADGKEVPGAKELKAMSTYGRFDFVTAEGEQVLMKVGLSCTSMQAARMNLAAEMPGWDFDAVRASARKQWNDALGRIEIKTADESVKRIFYTAMYHAMIAPFTVSDVSGSYRGHDGKVHGNHGHRTFTALSLWDTYRAWHPLMTLIRPEMVPEMVNTMLDICDEQGRLPIWPLYGCETEGMIGYPAVPVVADAVLKGIKGVDPERAYAAMRKTAMGNDRGLRARREYGYIPCDSMMRSVAFELEYDLADWAIAQVARKLGKEADYDYFMERSRGYKKVFDKSINLMRGKDSKGEWNKAFDPIKQIHFGDEFCEGNAWQYTWLVPHDIEGLTECFGSREATIAKLDSLFEITGDLGEEAAPDISGLIGMYAHGNEPSHHVLYLYNLLGEPWKTAERVRQVLGTMYHDDPVGMEGNEDMGQMSAWYIMSAMGLYQVEPAGGKYVFGSPILDEAVLKIGKKKFRIVAHNVSAENKYIKSVKLNGRAYDKWYITHEDMARGGTLEFFMGGER